MKKLMLLPFLFLFSCGTGTVVTFGKGGITVTPPSEPIVIPTDSNK